MNIILAYSSSEAETILSLVKNALKDARDLTRLCGLVRGLEISISTLQGSRSTASDSINRLQQRSLRLSESRDDYHLGVALGMNLATKVVSACSPEWGTSP